MKETVEVDGLDIRVANLTTDNVSFTVVMPNGPQIVPDSDALAEGWEQ